MPVTQRSSWRSVRREPSSELHKIFLRMRRDGWENGQLWTEGQEAFMHEIIAELVWRSARHRRAFRRCWCELCR